jgi:hypothetical protein
LTPPREAPITVILREEEEMNFNTTRVAFAAAILIGGSAYAQEMPWAKSFDEANKQAATSHKLVMVDFYTDW